MKNNRHVISEYQTKDHTGEGLHSTDVPFFHLCFSLVSLQ